ncbi:PKD domain-containing protein [Ensifer aridi]|uniref:PKD domain-containing protein n=2 Tax=Ensifer aridi TaxID=1708715 RepID=UPI0011116F22|nr:PKD domain-containing protein [Ensifer aridi]
MRVNRVRVRFHGRAGLIQALFEKVTVVRSGTVWVVTVLAGLGGFVIPADGVGALDTCAAERMAKDEQEAPAGGLSASPRSGPAPLDVIFSASGGGAVYFGGAWLDFGDGERTMVCRPGSGCRVASATHTYSQAGTYRARLIGEGEGERLLLGSVTITVGH